MPSQTLSTLGAYPTALRFSLTKGKFFSFYYYAYKPEPMRNPLLYLSILTLLWTITACQKEVTTQSASKQLTKTTVKEGDSLYITYYDYDSQNRLVSLSGSDNQGRGKQNYFTIHYDAQGRMDSATVTFGEVYSFQYDSQNRIVQRLGTSSASSPYSDRHTYAYDTKNRLVADTAHSYWGNEIFEYATYAYDQNDNILKVQIFRNNGGTYHIEKSLQAQFDNKRNPYYFFGHQLYFVVNDANGGEYLLSKNNRVKETFDNGDVMTYSYVYDSDLPKSSSMTDSSDPGWEADMSFAY